MATIFTEDFTGTAGAVPNTQYWDTDIAAAPHWGDDGVEDYVAGAALLDGSSHLVITASKVGTAWQSGRIKSKGKLTVGPDLHLEFKAKCDAGQGFWPALWLLGDNDNLPPVGPTAVSWPANGEIDLMEAKNTMATLYGSLHFPGHSGAGAITNTVNPTLDLTNYHTYSIDWSTKEIVFKCDGVTYATVLRDTYAGGAWPFADGSQFYIIMNLAVGGSFPGAPDGTTPSTGTMTVDYFTASSFNAGYRAFNGPEGLVAFNPLMRTKGQAQPGLWP